jgi:ribose transport system substrate-binding protein
VNLAKHGNVVFASFVVGMLLLMVLPVPTLLLDLLLFYDCLTWVQSALIRKEMSPEVVADSFQYLIDELLDRSMDNTRFDPQDAVLKGGKYEIRASYTDQFDRQKCKAIAQDALGKWNDIACMVGLFEYEPPILLDAVKSANLLQKVKVVAFDENPETLQGILDGHVHGTVVQNPYEYGRASVELLGKLLAENDADKRKALLPASGFLNIPARKITKAEVSAFWADLKAKTGAK